MTQESFENWLSGKHINIRRGAQVWKYIFRKSIIDKFHLRFPPHIVAGEDTMFLSSYLLNSKSFLNIPDLLYTYIIRPDGLFMSNLHGINPLRSLQTKIDLLEERMRIGGFYRILAHCSVDEVRSLYSGSAIFSCFQLAWLYSNISLKYCNYFKIYAELPEVQLCIKRVVLKKDGGIKRWLPFWLLKKNMYRTLYLMFMCAHKFKIELKM